MYICNSNHTMYQNYNRYSYVLNNPLKYTDPSGWRYMVLKDNKVDDPPINFDNFYSNYGGGGGASSDFFSFGNSSSSSPHYNWSTGQYMQGGNQISFQSVQYWLNQTYTKIYTGNRSFMYADVVSSGGIGYGIIPVYEYRGTNNKQFNGSSGNTQSGWDLHNISQDFRKGAGFANTIVQPFAQAWSRANTYGTPLKGGTTLVWLEKGIKNFKIRKPAIELSTKTVGQISSTLSKVRYTAGFAGMFFGGADIIYNGFSISNTLDFTMSGLALTGFGSGLAMGYFYTNTALQITTGKDIGQHIGSFLKP